MKTIEINLIGELRKTSKAVGLELKQETLDTKTRILVIAILCSVLVIFTTSFGVWFFAQLYASKHLTELNSLKAEHAILTTERNKLAAQRKNLQEHLRVAKFKQLVRNQINDAYIPWSLILKDLAFKLPQDIVLFNIEKTGTRGRGQTASVSLKISGVIPANNPHSPSQIGPLTAISFLILNINEDEKSLLSNAKVNSIDYDAEISAYKFEVEATVTPPARLISDI